MDERVKPFEDRMRKAYDYLLADFATIRAGRANPHVLDKIKIDYSAGRKYFRSRGEDDSDCAVGKKSSESD